MKILLDTNSLIWLIGDPKENNLGNSARLALMQASEVYVSSMSVVEMQIKAMIGKLQMPDDLQSDIALAGLQELALQASHAEVLPHFPELVRHDPFDRMLLCQAFAEGLTFLTADHVLLSLGLDYVQDSRR